MPIDEDKVLELLKSLAKEANLNIDLRAAIYREDYRDYIVVVGDVHYCEIREKLVDDFIQLKHKDVRRELIYKMNYPMELEEWQKDEFGIVSPSSQRGEEEEKMIIDDSEQNDWV